MKKRKLFIAALLVVVATSVAVVSCKKETQNVLSNNTPQSVKVFTPPQVEDMNAYLKNFKQKMKSATRDMYETLSLEEAAWHLSSLANYDFANVNVDCDDVRFDTLYAHVNITDRGVLLCDLYSVYEEISTSIDNFYNNLSLDNKHFRFINAFVSENGEIAVSLLTTFSYGSRDITDTCWYFQDEWVLADTCYYYFPTFIYPVQTIGTSELQRVLNLIISHQSNGSSHYYYTISSIKNFPYQNYIDPYGSPSYNYSRIFASLGTNNLDLGTDICYYFDSYLGLGVEYLPVNEYILSWVVTYCYVKPKQFEIYNKEYHDFKVYYGIRHERNPEPGHEEY